MYQNLTTEQLKAGIEKLENSTKQFVDMPGVTSEETKAKFRLQVQMLAAARLELSRREAAADDIPF